MKTAMALMLFLLAVVAIGSADILDERPPVSAPTSSAAKVNTFAGPDFVDLKWYPENAPEPTWPFVRWELYRDDTCTENYDVEIPIDNPYDESTQIFTDKGLLPNHRYCYRMIVVRKQDGLSVDLHFFDTSAMTGPYQGRLYRHLILDSGTIEMKHIIILPGGTLDIGGENTTVEGQTRIYVVGGRLEIDKARFKDVALYFGTGTSDPEGEPVGAGWIKDAHLETGKVHVGGQSTDVKIIGNTFYPPSIGMISIAHQSNAAVEGNGGTFDILLSSDEYNAIEHNRFQGSIDIKDQAYAYIHDNWITSGPQLVHGRVAVYDDSKAVVISNTITAASSLGGVHSSTSSYVYVNDNKIEFVPPVQGEAEAEIVLEASRGRMSAERNKIINGIVWLAGDANLGEFSFNVITGGELRIRDNAEATIERNTIQDGMGIRVDSDSAKLVIRHNCIRNNTTGLYVSNDRSRPIDVRYNYWNHEKGPIHACNPEGGLGEFIYAEGADVLCDPFVRTPEHCRDDPPTEPLPNLRVTAVDVVQVVAGVDGLVIGKPLAVQAQVEADKAVVEPAGVRLSLADGSYNEFYVLEQDNVDPKTHQLKTASTGLTFHQKGSKTLVFFPGVKPSGAIVTATVKVNPDGTITESVYTDNSLTAKERVVTTYWGSEDPHLRVMFYFLDKDRQEGSPLGAHFERLAEIQPHRKLVNRSFPLADGYYDYDVSVGTTEHSCINEEKYKQIEREMRSAFNGYGSYIVSGPAAWWDDKVCGMYARNRLFGLDMDYLQVNYAPRVLITGQKQGRNAPAAVFVSFGAAAFMEELDRMPTAVAGGLEVADRRVYDALWGNPTYSCLGYWGGSWIDKASYAWLLEDQASDPPGSLASTSDAEELLLISGMIRQDDAVTLDPFLMLPSGLVDEPQQGEYAVALLNGGGQPLYTHSFDVDFTSTTLTQTAFILTAPYMAGTERVAIEKEGTEIASRSRTPSAPTVQVVYPNGGEDLSGPLTITWTGSDADGDDLVYAVQYSYDNGDTWQPLAVDLTETNLQWHTDQQPGGHGSCLIRVMASDGFNTSTDVSDSPFSVETKAPWVGIRRPIADAVYSEGNAAVMEAVALDPEDSWLEGSALSWTSDQDGALGTGNLLTTTLSLGQHTLSVTASDADGLTATTRITVTVSTETRPDLSITADDIELPYEPMVCRPEWLGVQVRNVVTDTIATVSFYDGDPDAGGALIGERTFYAEANVMNDTGIVWWPTTAGERQIHVVIADADPAESDIANNRAAITVEVAEGSCDVYLPTILRQPSY